MRVFSGISDLQSAVGTHLGHSSWRQITQDQVTAFAEVTSDTQWIHVDPRRASEGPFGAAIAHGYLTLSLVSALCWDVYKVDGVGMQVNYGANKLRFPAPVVVDSRVRVGVELLSVDRAKSGYFVICRITVDIEHEAKPACVVETVSLLVP